jgi:tRNA G10  N-methylase Trm11
MIHEHEFFYHVLEGGKMSERTSMKNPIELLLLSNIQFIYELHLAKLEMEALTEGASLRPDFRSFQANGKTSVEWIQKRSAYVGQVNGAPTDYFKLTRKNITKAFNQYATHWFYPYKGKFHPQMVRALANIMGLKPGMSLLDPFSGSGTTMVEGALLGLKTFGYDVSPLCVLIGKVKVNAVHHWEKIRRHCEDAPLRDEPLAKTPEISDVLADPVRSLDLLARMISRSDEARRGQDFLGKLQINRDKMLRSLALLREGCQEVGLRPLPAACEIADARRLPLTDASMDGIITSPPYSIALNYVQNDAHALEALGYDLGRIREEFIGVRGSGRKRFDLYEEDMEKAYGEMARVLKRGGKAAVILGNMTFEGDELKTVDRCIGHMARRGLELTDRIDKLIYGLYNVMQREWILIFRKP